MKKNILLTLLFFITINIFSQKIEIIDYGNSYLEIREMTLYDFKDDCKFRYTFSDNSAYRNNYARSNFANELEKKDYSLWSKYRDELGKLGDEFENHAARNLWSEFDKCSKTAFEYTKLHLKKFEILSEYFKNLYNYKIDKNLEKEKINKELESIKNKNSLDRIKIKQELKNDAVLKNLKSEKLKSFTKINSEFDKKIDFLIHEKKGRISTLDISNYSNNKALIEKEYNPKIKKIKKEKRAKIQSSDLFWDDKISLRLEKLKNEIDTNIQNINTDKIDSESSIKKEIKEKNNLNELREQIENDYIKKISVINAEIQVMLKNNCP